MSELHKSYWSQTRPTNDSHQDHGELVVIGIDFGTTYSGAAWATARGFDNEKIEPITSWPGTDREEAKAPTTLYYEDGKTMWGYQVPDDVEPIQWFKLLILKEGDLSAEMRSSEFILNARRVLRESGKTAVEAIADYLHLLWEHIQKELKKSSIGRVVDSMAFQVCITIPAIWKGYARHSMESAAKKAGILEPRPGVRETTLSFVPEPEAAALSSLCDLGKRVGEGEVYLVCDAGGGTVDLITYDISCPEPIHLSEAVEGTGGLCGAIFIDAEFRRIIKARLGRQWGRLSNASIKRLMKDEWEDIIKPRFTPKYIHKEYIVKIPNEAFESNDSRNDTTKQPAIKNGRIHFKASHIQQAFTDVFSKIDKLIDAQIEKTIKQDRTVTGIVLVGGLGGSLYLYTHLNTKYGKYINILKSKGMESRTAICRGAVFKGFQQGNNQDPDAMVDVDAGPQTRLSAPIQVVSTISRASYGISFNELYDKRRHIKKDKFFDSDDGKWKAGNQVQWYLKKGERVSTMQPVNHPFFRIFSKDWSGRFKMEILECKDETPPTRWTESVEKSCTFQCTLDKCMPVSRLRNHITPNGEKKKRLDYDVKMFPSGASLDCVVIVNGTRLGKANVSVKFE